MTTRRVAGLAILLCLTAALAWIFWSRGIPGGLSGQVVALKTPYKSEREWAVTQIAADINEMGAFANQRPARAFDAGLQPQTPWEPSAFRPISEAALGGVPAAPSLTEAGAPELYESLTALDVRAIAGAAQTVSKSLAANMRNARAHESAALVLGAFALREAADWFTDVRWPLNRMTAHLAVAATLRNGEAGSPDGALAHVILSVLSQGRRTASGRLGDVEPDLQLRDLGQQDARVHEPAYQRRHRARDQSRQSSRARPHSGRFRNGVQAER